MSKEIEHITLPVTRNSGFLFVLLNQNKWEVVVNDSCHIILRERKEEPKP